MPLLRRVTIASLGLLGLLAGCQTSCLDDGFAWEQGMCPSTGASATDATGETGESTTTDGTATTTATATATMGTMSDAGTATQGTTTGTASESDSATTGAGVMWCDDADDDGFGDPGKCMPGTPGQDPPPGKADNGDDCDDADPDTFPGAAENEDPPGACMQDQDGDGFGDSGPGPGVTPGSDCDDGDPSTFPGAAPNDDPEACMTDVDGDDWGDDTPGAGVTPGSDCDDGDANTFPGAAESEAMADACMKDEDMDGWGDANVPDGVVSGADCYDTNADLNPGDQQMFSVLDGGDIGSVDVVTGAVAVFATVDIAPLEGEWSVISAAISPEDGSIYVTNAAQQRLSIMDYCVGDAPSELSIHNRSICGITFNAEGLLFGVDSGADELVQFDVTTGDVIDAKPITVDGAPHNLTACGMAYDCVSTRLLITDGGQSRILSVDPATGDATVVADVDEGQWGAVGQEYDPVSREVYTNNGSKLYKIAIDGSNDYTQPATLSMSLNDLAYGPTCN